MKRCQEPGTDFKNMKKLFFSIAALALAASSNAQQVTAPEPEFIGSYCMLTSDSTYVVLPKENGKVEKHQNKFSKFSKIAGAVSDLGFAGGMVGLSTGSMAGLETGVRVMGTAAGVGLAADAVNTLAGVEGMDIAFVGGKSAYSIKKDGKDIRLLIKAEKNDYDPMGIYRIVRFKASKKDRRIQWLTLQPAVLGSSDAQKRDTSPSLDTNMAVRVICSPSRLQSLNQESMESSDQEENEDSQESLFEKQIAACL